MPPKVYVPGLSGGRLPRDARARRRSRGAEVGDLVPGQPRAGPADRDRARARLRRVERNARGHSRRRRGYGVAHRCGGGTRCGDARPRRRRSAAVVGAGVNGRAAARTFLARGREVRSGTSTRRGARPPPRSSAPTSRGHAEEALAADLLVTVTPGHEVAAPRGHAAPGPARQPDGRRRARQGRDRRGGARRDARLLRRLGAGEPRRRARTRRRDGRARARRVTELGAVLAGVAEAARRRRDHRPSTRPGSRSRT